MLNAVALWPRMMCTRPCVPSEEHRCRFCGEGWPSWTAALQAAPRAPPTMKVEFAGHPTQYLPVAPGPHGMKQFKVRSSCTPPPPPPLWGPCPVLPKPAIGFDCSPAPPRPAHPPTKTPPIPPQLCLGIQIVHKGLAERGSGHKTDGKSMWSFRIPIPGPSHCRHVPSGVPRL